ncbi:hypothetical protein E1176_17720 [Fulvivirga sp. RKSG066]|uniref:hypothetical protein n=1 Tax=Fulvivirga aurantia TaxID=2529383 RepID=UPI0012BC8C7D|nr:hypothetical protein [Fulvivirga aurantia]MTI22875.1 hypothetical protein [Fulvivirga aurantia]
MIIYSFEIFSEDRINWFGLYLPVYFSVAFYVLYIKRTLKLKSVAADQENLYIIEKGQEVVIPFVEIKEVKLKTAIGTHSVQLYRDLGFGKEFLFKSSLWYPFNFKKVDDQVYELQRAIERAKREYQPNNYRALGS